MMANERDSIVPVVHGCFSEGGDRVSSRKKIFFGGEAASSANCGIAATYV